MAQSDKTGVNEDVIADITTVADQLSEQVGKLQSFVNLLKTTQSGFAVPEAVRSDIGREQHA